MPQAVYVIWAVLLVIVILALPFLVFLLHKTLNYARFIEKYFADMLTAGLGIAHHTGNIPALEKTIETATVILEKAGDIDEHVATIEKTLASRASLHSGDY